MDHLKSDLKHALRILTKRKALSVAAILTLALGIGINTTIFSLVHGILLRPLPYPASEEILSVITSWPQKERSGFSPANFLDVRERATTLRHISAYGIWSYDVSGDHEPESLTACRATYGFFEVLGVQPLYGRTFLADEETDGKHRVVILKNSLWKRKYGGNPNLVGRSILLDGVPHTVVGVMPEKFAEPPFVDIWTPLVFSTEQKAQRGSAYLEAIARLKSGVSRSKAQSEMNTLGSSLAKDYPQFNAGIGINLIPTAEALTGSIKPTLLVLWSAVIFVLLVACANLANLMLVSTISRDREFALRAALGASSRRLSKQLLTECMLLAIIGGSLGILFSLWAIPGVVALTPEDTPRIGEVELNGTVLLFSLLLSIASGVAFGLAPAFRIGRHNLSRFLKEGTSVANAGPGRVSFRNFLMSAQMAVVLVLLVGAGLMIRSFDRLRSVNPGFNVDKLLNLQVFLPQTRYRDPDARRDFSSSMLEKLRTLPDVESVAIASPAPFDSIPHLIDTGFRIEGLPPFRTGEEPIASYTRVSEDYFRTMRIPIRKGRSFRTTDHQNAPRVAMINESMEKKFWPHKGAIGQRIILGIRQPMTFEIVGVVGSVKQVSLSSEDRPQIYVPFQQSPSGAITVIVRTKGAPENSISGLKRQFWAVDPMLPAEHLSTTKHLVLQSLHRPRSNTVLLSLFAGIAFLLAMIGLYGVIAYSVSQRTREIGLRMSLGAQRGAILRMLLTQGLRMTLIGVATGTAGALAVTHLISSLLFNVSSRDPFVFAIGAGLMTAISMIACYIPARRAMKVDPLVALRYE